MLSPAVVDFFETALRRGDDALNIEDLAMAAGSPSLGQTLDGLDIRRATGATVLAILRDGIPLVSPPGELDPGGRRPPARAGHGRSARRLEKLITAGAAS